MHLFCLQVVLRVSEYHKWTNRDNRGEREDEKGARLHLIGFLILCDDAAQAVVSNCSLFLSWVYFSLLHS